MNCHARKLLAAVAVFALLSAISHPLSTALAQGTAFTYQGQLQDNGNLANGTYNLTFTLYANSTGGAVVAGPVTNNGVSVSSNGLFTVTIDFGSMAWNGQTNWLQIGVATNGSGSFTTLSPLQELTPAPYAIYAGSAGTLPGLLIEQNTDGAPDVILGSSANYVSNGVVGATIGGGGVTNYFGPVVQPNSVTADFGTVGGGTANTASGKWATVGGGDFNTADDEFATVAGGYFNTAGYLSAVAGGQENTAAGTEGAVGGGDANIASGELATVGGGYINTASGLYATVPGGVQNTAAGYASLAAGENANAPYSGDFVWADNSSSGSYSATVANQFAVRASGGILFDGDLQLSPATYHHLSLTGGNSLGYLYGSYLALGDGIHLGYNFYYDASGGGHIINHGGATSRISVGYGTIDLAVGGSNGVPSTVMLHVSGAGVCANGAVSDCSDRNAKQDFTPVDPAQVLQRALQLPVSEWSYKIDAATRHIGPMAQDFYAAFAVGPDDKHIATIDEGGVALAAIQGLNQKVEAQAAEAKAKDVEIADLKTRLEKLEQLIESQKGNQK